MPTIITLFSHPGYTFTILFNKTTLPRNTDYGKQNKYLCCVAIPSSFHTQSALWVDDKSTFSAENVKQTIYKNSESSLKLIKCKHTKKIIYISNVNVTIGYHVDILCFNTVSSLRHGLVAWHRNRTNKQLYVVPNPLPGNAVNLNPIRINISLIPVINRQ